jgi:hypothetical protein
MAEYYQNPDDQADFEEYRQTLLETTAMQYYFSLPSSEWVTYEATRFVMDRFHPDEIVSRVVTIEILKEIWIGWYQLFPGTWDPFYLDDYCLYDLLWVTLFYHHLTPQTTSSWGLCLDCPFPTVSPPLT